MKQNQFEKDVIELNRQITDCIVEHMRERSDKFNIPPFQLHVLLYLSEHEYSVSELGKQMHMAKSNMSTLLKSMEKDELLTRIRDVNDERITKITLSDKGRQIVDEYNHTNFNDSFTNNRPSKEDQEIILLGLTKLLEVLKKGN